MRITPGELKKHRVTVPVWGAPSEPQAPFVAPTPASIEGWSWEDSLLLFGRAAYPLFVLDTHRLSIVEHFMRTVHALNPDQRTALLEALGENAEPVKQALGWE